MIGQVPEAALMQQLQRIDDDIIVHDKYQDGHHDDILKTLKIKDLTQSDEIRVPFADESEEVGSLLSSFFVITKV